MARQGKGYAEEDMNESSEDGSEEAQPIQEFGPG